MSMLMASLILHPVLASMVTTVLSRGSGLLRTILQAFSQVAGSGRFLPLTLISSRMTAAGLAVISG